MNALLRASCALVLGSSAAAQVPRAHDCLVLDHPQPTSKAYFGQAVLPLDFNRDGLLDLAVGAPGKPGGGRFGQVYVFYGPLTPSSRYELLVPTTSQANDLFGWSLVAGDLTGDGFDELIVGAPGATMAGAAGAGNASVWHYATGANELFELAMPAALAGAKMGVSVAVGDFGVIPGNELAVGVPRGLVTAAGLSSGVVALFHFTPGAQPGLTVLENPSPTTNDGNFGHDLAVADWNRDGRDDLVVSAIFNHAVHAGVEYAYAGQVLVFANPVGPVPMATLDNPSPFVDDPFLLGQPAVCTFQRFGMSIDAADINADGHAEVAVGAPRKDDPNGTCDPGRAFLFSGRTYTSSAPRDIEFERIPSLDDDLVGYRVMFGDLVGDGSRDLIVGSLSTARVPSIMVWDGQQVVGQSGAVGLPTERYHPRPGVGPHFMGGMASGRFLGTSKEQLVLGDFDYSMPGYNKVGRVVVACFR